MIPTRKPSPSASMLGFTLIEILVTLAVLGLLMVGLGQGLSVGLATLSTATRMTDSLDAFDAADRTLRHLIAQADPGNGTELPRFTGGPDRLSFITRLPEVPGAPTNRVEVALGVDKTHRLILRWRPYLHAKRTGPAPFTETGLLSGVARITVHYWSAEGWSTAPEAGSLPRLVRIRVVFLDQGQRHWPDIVAGPELDRL
jgi:general secretion pathway protein J